MSEKENLKLSDKSIIPDDDYIFSIIGDKQTLWQKILKYASDSYSETYGSWNYYNDGKRWLFKLMRKKKTILWAAIVDDTFRMTFYFPDKAQPLIEVSNLPQRIKDDFKTAKKYGAIRPVSIIVNEPEDADNISLLIDIKQKIK
jgi:hypothetical protein